MEGYHYFGAFFVSFRGSGVRGQGGVEASTPGCCSFHANLGAGSISPRVMIG